METFVLVVMGIFSGVVSGMTGASGVMVMIPLLTTFFGFPIVVAVGTSLMADVISSGPISYTYHKNKNLDIKTGLLLGLGAVVGAQVASGQVTRLPENLIVLGIGIAMVFIGMRMWRDGVRRDFDAPTWNQPRWFTEVPGRWIVGVILGFLLGIMTGLFGAGGGILIFLVLYFLLRVSLKVAIGTAAFVMIMSSLSGAVGYWRLGNLDLEAGLIIGISATIGGVLSAYLANHVDEGLLAKVVGTVFILLAVIMLGIRLMI
jgi:uncharacterized membrane protein YfcA